MRCLALDVGEHVDDARGAEPELFFACTGGLKRQHVVRLGRLALDQVARTERAFFLVGVEQHGDGAKAFKATVLQQLEGVQNHCGAALVVGDAGAVGLVAFDLERRFFKDAFQVHRVLVRQQQHVLAALALFGGNQVVADHVAHGLVARDLEAQVLQARFQQLRVSCKTLGVAGAGFNVDQFFKRGNYGWFFSGGCSQQCVVLCLGMRRSSSSKTQGCDGRGKNANRAMG